MMFGIFSGFSPENELTVATWNILHGNGVINSQKQEIKHMRADIIALQEVDEKTARVKGKSCLETLGNGTYYFNAFGKECDYQGGEFGIGFLSKSYLYNTKTSFRAEGNIEKDGIMKTQIKKDGKTISVYNVHFSYQYYWVRRRQMAQAAEIFKNDSNKYKILMGDFNVTSLNEFEVFKDFNMINSIYNPLETYKGDDWETKCIDNIIYSDGFYLIKYEMDETKYSDHNALIARFKMR